MLNKIEIEVYLQSYLNVVDKSVVISTHGLIRELLYLATIRAILIHI